MEGRRTTEIVVRLEGLNVECSTLNLELRDMENIARYLVIGGIILIVIGGGVFLAARLGIPFGRLPGDIRVERGSGIFYFPIVTSCLLSILLTIILNIIVRFFNR
jgi:hypothetical protein